MKMKKVSALLCTMMILSTAVGSAYALGIKPQETAQLSGLITEVIEGGFIMEDAQQGTVLLNVDPETVLEGVLAETPLAEGMFVFVTYSGLLTNTDPPQTHADRLGCYTLEGKVDQLLDSGVLITGDPLFGDVVVRLSEYMPHVFRGVNLKVYYDGSMAMSSPAKVTASYIVVPVVKGKVESIQDRTLTLRTSEDEKVTLDIGSHTLLPASWFNGELKGRTVTVYYQEGEAGAPLALEIIDPAAIVLPNEPLEVPEEEQEEAQEEAQDGSEPETDEPDKGPTPTDSDAQADITPEPDAPDGKPTQRPAPTESAKPSPVPSVTPQPEQSPVPSPSPTQAPSPSPGPSADAAEDTQ